MKISRKAYYGLRAVLIIAQAKKPLSIHTLSEMESLPQTYLEKILQTLRKTGIVIAHKGVTGGYTLAHSPDEINVWDILSHLDTPMKTFPHSLYGSLPCLQVSHCQTNEVWRILENKIEETLSAIPLSQLIPKNIS